MKVFITTDRDTILECLQGEKLLNIVPDGLGNVMLLFETVFGAPVPALSTGG